MRIFTLFIIISTILMSCGQNDNKKKELELRERELALKEKDFEFKNKAVTIDSIQNSKQNGLKGSNIKNQLQSNKQINLPLNPTEIKKQIVAQMVKDKQLKQNCINDAGGINEAINLKPITLSNSGKQYLMSGGKCGFGARTPVYWVYQIKDGNVKMLADIGACDNVKVTKKRVNGYYVIEISAYYGGEGVFYSFLLKYNGTIYKLGPGTNKGRLN